jgi:hypothetical protein
MRVLSFLLGAAALQCPSMRALQTTYFTGGAMAEAARVGANDEDVIPLDEVAKTTGASERLVRDRKWRQENGLAVIRFGKRILGVRRSDLLAAMRRGF